MRDALVAQVQVAGRETVAPVGEDYLGQLAGTTGIRAAWAPGRSRARPRTGCFRGAGRVKGPPREDGPYRRRRSGSSWRDRRGSCQWPCHSGAAPPFGVVGAGHRAVDAHRPLELPGGVGIALQARQQHLPGAIPAPTDKPVVAGLPRTVALGHVTPGSAGSQPPQDALDDRSVIAPLPTPASVFGKRGEPLPRRVRQSWSAVQRLLRVRGSHVVTQDRPGVSGVPRARRLRYAPLRTKCSRADQ